VNKTSIEFDVLIVGAGVTGALVASRMAEQGARVLVLEAGPPPGDRKEKVGRYARASEKIPSAPYEDLDAKPHSPIPKVIDGKEGGHYAQQGPDMFKSTYLRLGGGSTWHWLGNTPRLLPNDFLMKSLYGVGDDWPLTYEELEPSYSDAEAELGVSGDRLEWDGLYGAMRSTEFPMPPIWRAYGDRVFERLLGEQTYQGNQLVIRSTPQARNSIPYQGRPPCAGNSSCVPICPIAAKYDATVHIAKASSPRTAGSTPAIFRYRCVVKRLEADQAGRVVGVHYQDWSSGAAKDEVVRASRYVLAAHAIETPVILLASGLGTRSPVGRYLMDHPQGYGGALLPEPVFPFRGPPVTSGIDVFRDGDFRAQRAAFRISIGNDGWGRMQPIEETVRRMVFDRGLLGKELRQSVNHTVTRMLRLSYSTEMLPEASNRVELGPEDRNGHPKPKIHFTVPNYNLQAFEFATKLFEWIFQRIGVNSAEMKFSYPDKKFSGAGHIMGTCRMGMNTSNSVVDSFGRMHEHANLFIVGSSVFTTGGTANPTLTAAALALRTAEAISKDLHA
tara:strand:+ start:2529 stop:4205 length:1677 start_codon:yes stop_codon:yes gene_type:complete